MKNISDRTQIIDAYVLGELEGFIRALEDLNIEPREIREKVIAQIYDIDRLYYLLKKYSILGTYDSFTKEADNTQIKQ